MANKMLPAKCLLPFPSFKLTMKKTCCPRDEFPDTIIPDNQEEQPASWDNFCWDPFYQHGLE